MMFKTFDEYMSGTAEQKFEYFYSNRQNLALPANYWIKYANVKDNMAKYGPDVFTLDYLIGKNEDELIAFFTERSELLKLVPQLLGIREQKFEKPTSKKILKVEGIEGEYLLNFSEIDVDNLEQYLTFVFDSGLADLLLRGLSKSVNDYAVGVEAGMDSNGRKNRSGQRGELYMENVLSTLAESYGFKWRGQTTYQYIKNEYNVELDDSLETVRFDGSLYNPTNGMLYLFEINNFSSGGSKLKASGGEFSLRQQVFANSTHQFIYITDGQGWDTDASHLKKIISSIDNVFNFSMIQHGYLTALIDSVENNNNVN